jgi:iron complex outermembrane receptor protein
VDWSRGPVSATLSNSYLSGYGDQIIIGKPDRRVGAYSLWNLSGGWDVTPAFKLRATVQNLFDKAPPFSQQAWFFLSGYDPSYTDTRGRSVQLSANYTFK